MGTQEPRRESPSWILDLVRRQIADIIGYDHVHEVQPDATFVDLGFNSMAAVELSARLSAEFGVDLPFTLGFDYPTPALVAGYLSRNAGGDATLDSAPAQGQTAMPRDEIVIVGLSCRFPGGADTPEALWQLVASGTDAIGPFPADRGWDNDRLFDRDPDRSGHTYVREGGFLTTAADFDAEFFGISPREAIAMDPQQRLLLEEAWTAIESAGIDPATLRGSDTATFVGIATHDYYGAHAASIPAQVEGWFGVGTAGSVASGRLAYTLGLEGPAVTLDTACSSSLVAIHLAYHSLRRGECSLALAGGATVMASPMMFVEFSRQRALSPGGRCHSYAESADGTAWAEGAGVVVLERLSDAERNGHRVLAIVRGSAINQDGASNGLSAPNGLAQQRVIRRALADAGLAADEIDLVEGHGTATPLGDPIEAEAILATYGQGRPADRPLRLGSLKSNIGHAQAAAGVGAVAKVVMSLRNNMMPRTLHVDRPSSLVDWSSGSVVLLTEPASWRRSDRPRRAGVSAFGISGTNAHLILEEPPAAEPAALIEADAPNQSDEVGDADSGSIPWVVSARGEDGLQAQVAQLRAYAESHPELAPLEVARSLLATRSLFEERAAVVGADRRSLLNGLDALLDGDLGAPGVARGVAAPRRVAFIYPGQGSQWSGMALGLFDSSPVFARAFRACDRAMRQYVDWSLEAVLRGEPGAPPLDGDDVVQPALFAVEWSLTELWRSCGVVPEIVVGHSQGEIVAACAAGWLSLDDGVRVVAHRSRVLGALAGSGGMAAIADSEGAVRALIAKWPDRLWIGCLNGPTSMLVSGDSEALGELLQHCESTGIWARRVAIGYAAHTPHMERIRSELLNALGPVTAQQGTIEMRSTMTGKPVDIAELNSSYWYRHLREPVRFDDVVAELIAQGIDTFIEVSPHPVMAASLESIVGGSTTPQRCAVLGTLRRHQGDLQCFMTSVTEALVRGVPADLGTLFPRGGASHVTLPTYPFRRKRYWLAADAGNGGKSVGLLRHPLLVSMVEIAARPSWLFVAHLDGEQHQWLKDHVVMDRVVVSGTTLVELAMAVGRELGYDSVDELVLELPLVLTGRRVEVQLWVGEPDEADRRPIHLFSRHADEGAWSRHATGTLSCPESSGAVVRGGVDAIWPPVAAKSVEVDELYHVLARGGLEYGSAFRVVRAAWRRGAELFAEVELEGPECPDADRFSLHPALFDAALHVAAVAVAQTNGRSEDSGPLLPFAWTGVRLHRTGQTRLRVHLTPQGNGAFALVGRDEDGAPVVTVDTIAARPISREQIGHFSGEGVGSLYALDWVGVGATIGRRDGGNWVALGGDDDWFGDLRRYPNLALLATAEAEVEVVILGRRGALDGDADEIRALTIDTLETIQDWLSDTRLADARLVVVTLGAVASGDIGPPDVAGAAVWGLVRSAQAEHPGRFVLLDVDHTEGVRSLVEQALATGEPQLIARHGNLLVPRLSRLPSPTERAQPWDGEGTVLITGGTGGLGALIACHLVAERGARHLLLVSRSGARASGVDELSGRLRSNGATVSVTACDVSDRDAVADLLSTIPPQHPLTAVIHAAGVIDDGVIATLSKDRVERVFRPKVDGALLLDELTRHVELDAFVLFSSVAGVVGAAGQGNYAAANSALDAVAARRQERGRRGTSIAWGWWDDSGAMTRHLGQADRARLVASGLSAMPVDEGLALFDAAEIHRRPTILAARLDRSHPRASWSTRTVIPAGRRSHRLSARLAQALPADRPAVVLKAVLEETAAILGHATAGVEPERSFKDLGLDSLGAIELRNHLSASAGVRLPSTLVFDHPNPAAVSVYLLEQVASGSTDVQVRSADAELERLDAVLAAIAATGIDPRKLAARLTRFLSSLMPPADDDGDGDDFVAKVRDASAEEIFQLLDDNDRVRW